MRLTPPWPPCASRSRSRPDWRGDRANLPGHTLAEVRFRRWPTPRAISSASRSIRSSPELRQEVGRYSPRASFRRLRGCSLPLTSDGVEQRTARFSDVRRSATSTNRACTWRRTCWPPPTSRSRRSPAEWGTTRKRRSAERSNARTGDPQPYGSRLGPAGPHPSHVLEVRLRARSMRQPSTITRWTRSPLTAGRVRTRRRWPRHGWADPAS